MQGRIDKVDVDKTVVFCSTSSRRCGWPFKIERKGVLQY